MQDDGAEEDGKVVWQPHGKLGLICLPTAILAATACLGAAKPDQSCTGEWNAVSIVANGSADGLPSGTDHSKPHVIKLTWDPSVPASTSHEDAVAGYYIFRRESGKGCDQSGSHCQQLNPSAPIKHAGCIDYHVEPGHTYIYQARAVSVRGTLSGFSNQAKATLP